MPVDLRPLDITDDRRCWMCGEMYRDCDCFEDTNYFVSWSSDASESEPDEASPTEGQARK